MKVALNDPLLRFCEKAEKPRVSIYIPTHRAGPETRQDPIRLKNLLREAREKLAAIGLNGEKADAMLRPGQSLLQDLDFWRHQQEGLAVFATPDAFRTYRLPYRVPELVVASEEFHLRPLLPLFAHDDRFFILALNKNHVRLYEANRYSARLVDVPEIPDSLAEAIQYDDGELQLQHHLSGPTGLPGHNSAIFHGQGGEKDIQDDQLLRFFRAVNRGVRNYLREEKSPLVLAGVEYYFPIYRSVNTYPNLMEEGVTGASETMPEEDLQRRALAVVGPHLMEAEEKALLRFQQIAGSNGNGSKKAARKVHEAVIAAYEGRVDALIIPTGKEIWGDFDEVTEQVTLGDAKPGRRRDLLDYAAMHTLLHGGEVFMVPAERIPGGTDVGALLRYNPAA